MIELHGRALFAERRGRRWHVEYDGREAVASFVEDALRELLPGDPLIDRIVVELLSREATAETVGPADPAEAGVSTLAAEPEA
ncbi:MAG TPA: hypothetical protein VM290_04740 [Gaiellaceae bacterium]|nr:hypothetical protein [Gaiellaceae bacterium]